MANDKFNKIVQLIREVIGLLADLIPVADTALDLVQDVRRLVQEFKEKQQDLTDA